MGHSVAWREAPCSKSFDLEIISTSTTKHSSLSLSLSLSSPPSFFSVARIDLKAHTDKERDCWQILFWLRKTLLARPEIYDQRCWVLWQVSVYLSFLSCCVCVR